MNFNIATKIFISGFILGLLAAFKITFIFTSLSIVLFVLLNYKMNLRGFVKYFSYLFLGFVVSFALSHIWLLDPEILKGYILNIKYILFYSNIQKVGINFFKDSIKELSNFFGYNFSLLFTFGLFMTFLYFLKEKEKLSIGKEITISFTQIQFLNLSFFILIFEFLSIIVEKKFHSYHFARTMTVISILSSFGLYQIFNIVSYLFHWKNFIKYKSKSVILIIISIFFISLSPISKVIYSWKIPLSYFQGQEAYLNYISKLNPRLSSFKDMYEVSNFINNHFEKNTKILASFLGSYHIIYFLKIDLINSMPQRSTYLSKKIFINYYDKFIDEMNQCDIFLVQTDDRFKSLTENEYSSYEAIENNSKTKKILETNFHTIFKTKSFILFERNGFHAKNNVKK